MSVTTNIDSIGLGAMGSHMARPLREARADSVLFGHGSATDRAVAQALVCIQNFPGVTLPGRASGV